MAFTAGAAIVGRLEKMYVEPTADLATPTWSEVGKMQGGAVTSQRNVAELGERDEDEILVLPGHISREVTVTITRRPGATNYDDLQTAFETGAKIGVAMMTGTITEVGQRGYQAEMYVTGWDDDQAHEGHSVAVTLRPAADYVTPPAFVEITV